MLPRPRLSNEGAGPRSFWRIPYSNDVARSLRVDYVGPVEAPKVLTDGSIRVPSYLTKAGVMEYKYSDGRTVREYRPPSEVFSPDSLASWPGLALTVGHPESPVTPANWASLAVGHVADNVRKDGAYIAADVIVKDGKALDAIKAGELIELSAGYYVEIDPTPGVSPEGDEYDAVQRAIVGNHVALGARDWGRAGNSVRLYGGDSACMVRPAPYSASVNATSANGAPEIPMTVKADATAGGAPAPAAETVKVIPLSEYERVCAERDAATAKLATVNAAAVSADSKVSERVALRVSALKIDSKIDTSADDRAIMVAAIVATDAKFKADGKSEDYIRARFDIAIENAPPASDATRVDSRSGPAFDALSSLAKTGPRADAGDDDGDMAVKAHKAMIERNRMMASKVKGK